MDETLTTAGEPQVIEGANTADVNTSGYMQVLGTDANDGSQVIESSTPMDSNVTYDNVEDTTPSFDMSKDFTQNLVQDAVQLSHQNNLVANDGHAMDNFLNHEYSYDKSEAGTYWVAGAINDVDTQMSFLNTLVNEELYDEMDLQKYYYDTTMATARAYAAQKKKETAYGFYRAAQEKAIAEAQLTGWYMPAEGNYMLGQYAVAQNVLEDPDAPDDQKARAQRISNTVEKWFNANQISTRGIKCLNLMNHEENVRHNTVMGELQKQANQIAGANAAANAALAKLQLRELQFQLEEYELQTGHNITQQIGLDNEDFLGHKTGEYDGFTALQGFGGTKDSNALAEMLTKSPGAYADVLTASNKKFVDDVLTANGKDAKTAYVKYKNNEKYTSMESYLNSEEGRGMTYFGEDSGIFDNTGKTIEGKKLLTTVIDNKVVAGYFESGAFIPLTKSDMSKTLGDGKTKVADYLNNAFGEKNVDWSGVTGVTIDGTTYGLGTQQTQTNYVSVANLSENGYKKYASNQGQYMNDQDYKNAIKRMTAAEGSDGITTKDGTVLRNLQYVPDKYENKNRDEYSIFKAEVNGETKYYSYYKPFLSDGYFTEVSANDIQDVPHVKDIPIESNKNALTTKNNPDFTALLNNAWVVGYDKRIDATYMASPRSDGTIEYFAIASDMTNNRSAEHYTYMVDNDVSVQEIKQLGFKTVEQKVTEPIDSSKTTDDSKQSNRKTTGSSKSTTTSNTKSSGSSSSVNTSKGYEAQNTVTNKEVSIAKYNPDTLKMNDLGIRDKVNEEIKKNQNYYGSFLGKETT